MWFCDLYWSVFVGVWLRMFCVRVYCYVWVVVVGFVCYVVVFVVSDDGLLNIWLCFLGWFVWVLYRCSERCICWLVVLVYFSIGGVFWLFVLGDWWVLCYSDRFVWCWWWFVVVLWLRMVFVFYYVLELLCCWLCLCFVVFLKRFFCLGMFLMVCWSLMVLFMKLLIFLKLWYIFVNCIYVILFICCSIVVICLLIVWLVIFFLKLLINCFLILLMVVLICLVVMGCLYVVCWIVLKIFLWL